jgi:hypothetical protein
MVVHSELLERTDRRRVLCGGQRKQPWPSELLESESELRLPDFGRKTFPPGFARQHETEFQIIIRQSLTRA